MLEAKNWHKNSNFLAVLSPSFYNSSSMSPSSSSREHSSPRSPRSPLVWGIVGASTIAQEYLIPAIRAEKHAVQSLLSNSPSHAKKYAEKNNIPAFTTSTSDFFRQDLNAVYISSTNEKHTTQAIKAAENNIHILCEKPLATTLEDAQKIVAVAKENKVVLAVNHHLRCAESVKLMKNILHNGDIGKPVALRLYHTFMMREHLKTWRLHKPEAGAGAILDVFVHQADLLMFLLEEEAESVVCQQQFFSLGNAKTNVEDSAMAIIQFPSGILAHTHESFTTPYTQTALHILGSKGCLEGYDLFRQQGGGSLWISNAKGRRSLSFPQRDCYRTTVALFVESLLGGGRPAADGSDGLKALKVALAAKKAAETGTRQSINDQA